MGWFSAVTEEDKQRDAEKANKALLSFVVNKWKESRARKAREREEQRKELETAIGKSLGEDDKNENA